MVKDITIGKGGLEFDFRVVKSDKVSSTTRHCCNFLSKYITLLSGTKPQTCLATK